MCTNNKCVKCTTRIKKNCYCIKNGVKSNDSKSKQNGSSRTKN